MGGIDFWWEGDKNLVGGFCQVAGMNKSLVGGGSPTYSRGLKKSIISTRFSSLSLVSAQLVGISML